MAKLSTDNNKEFVRLPCMRIRGTKNQEILRFKDANGMSSRTEAIRVLLDIGLAYKDKASKFLK